MLSLPDDFAPTPKVLIGTSVVLLFVATIFGGLNVVKVKTLRSSVADATASRESADRNRAQREKELKARESAIAAEQAKLAEREGKSGAPEGQLAQIVTEKTQLEAKLQDKDAEILALQKQIEDKHPASANPGAPSTMRNAGRRRPRLIRSSRTVRQASADSPPMFLTESSTF